MNLIRFHSSRWLACKKDFAGRLAAAPSHVAAQAGKAVRPRLRAKPSPFRWEDQFNLSLGPVTAREFHD
jgi:thiamine biosynthesis protein ThiC